MIRRLLAISVGVTVAVSVWGYAQERTDLGTPVVFVIAGIAGVGARFAALAALRATAVMMKMMFALLAISIWAAAIGALYFVA